MAGETAAPNISATAKTLELIIPANHRVWHGCRRNPGTRVYYKQNQVTDFVLMRALPYRRNAIADAI